MTRRLYLEALEARTNPSLSYVSYFGGDNSDEISSVGFDAAGNIYVAGRTDSSAIPLGSSQNGTLGRAFVAKLDPTASALIWRTYIDSEPITGLAVDAAGDAFICGSVQHAGFASGGTAQTAYGGLGDAFAAKLNPNGSIAYATYIGGNQLDVANGIAIDAAGDAFVTGYTLSANFPIRNALQGTFHVNSGGDAFVTRISPTGNQFLFSTFLGGNTNGPGEGGATFSTGNAIAVDGVGNPFVTGYTEAADFVTTPNAFQTTKGYAQDVFVTELKADGSQALFSTFLSGPGQTVDSGNGEDIAYAIAVDRGGSVLVAGSTTSLHFPLKNAFVGKEGNGSPGLRDGFVTKFDPVKAGAQQLVYSTYIGGSAIDDAYSIGLDRSGNAYVGGATSSHINFPLVHPFQKSFQQTGGFLSKFAPNGHVLFNSYNAVGADTVEGIGVSPFGQVVFVGSSNWATMHTTGNAFQPTFPDATDSGFIAMLAGTNKSDAGAETDGDAWTVHLGGPGAVSVSADPITGGIQSIVLQGTNSKIALSIKVRKAKAANGIVGIGAITGSAIGRISAAHADLTGAGINLSGALGALTIRNIANGADVLAAGTSADSTSIKAYQIGTGMTINVGGSLSRLHAASIGAATIQAIAVKTLTVTGDKKAAILGDFAGSVTLTSNEIALGSARIAGTFTGSITANAGAIRSFDAHNFVAGHVTADIIGKVRIDAVTKNNGGNPFGFTAHSSIGSVRVANLGFVYDPSKPTPQGDPDFEVKIA
jgi:Beta-propeller repeat